jgi:glutaredoxin 3
MAQVVMYATRACPYCTLARRLLADKGVSYEEIAVDRVPEKRIEMQRLSGRYTVPQIFVDGRPIGGYTDLRALDQAGELDRLLAGGSTDIVPPGEV